jgi:hypothetical protein
MAIKDKSINEKRNTGFGGRDHIPTGTLYAVRHGTDQQFSLRLRKYQLLKPKVPGPPVGMLPINDPMSGMCEKLLLIRSIRPVLLIDFR